MTVKTWEEVIPTDDGPMGLYIAGPEAASPGGAVLVFQEAFGVNDHIKDVTRRYAEAGFLAIAPDLFHRFDQRLVDYDALPAAKALIGQMTPERIRTDVHAAYHYAAARAERVATTGYCFGGRASFVAATELEQLAAAVVYYGGGIATGAEDEPLQAADGITCPLLCFFGTEDVQIPTPDVERIRRELSSAGVTHDLVVFDDVGHGFACDARPASYDREATEAAWLRTVAFLTERLGRTPVPADPGGGFAR